jgi:hypothetical protein
MKKIQNQNGKKETTLEDLYALMRENEEKSKREWAEIREIAKKREEEFLKYQEEARKSAKEWEKEKAEIWRQIGGISNSNGEVAEEYFINAFQQNPKLNGETYKDVTPNVRFPGLDDEYDIFLSNNKSIAIIEIKYNVKQDDIGRLKKKAENFRKFLPEYNKRKLYLGLASLSFRKTTEQKIIDEGIAAIKQVGDKMVINSKNLKVF